MYMCSRSSQSILTGVKIKPMRCLACILLFLIFLAVPRLPAAAADKSSKTASIGKPAVITKCYLSSKSKVKVKVSIPKLSAVKGSKIYLFALPLNRASIKKTDKPIASKKKKKSLTFTVKLKQGTDGSLLYSRFLVAQKSGKTYKAISSLRVISNASKKASVTTAFPAARSKKGLQTNAGMLEDAEQLGIQHAAINIDIRALLASPSQYNKSSSVSYQYNGTTYWFLRSGINSYDKQVKSLTKSGATVSAILLLGWRNDLKYLIYPSGRSSGHSFYAWNTKSPKARQTFAAMLSFLQSRYSSSKHGRIVNWILGNEVDNYKVYNYAGELSLSEYAGVYAQAFLLTYQTVTSVYANARVYISLDHLWNYSLPGTFTARAMLDKFASKMSAYGDIPWGLAYHPYSSPLTDPKFWDSKDMLTNTIKSPVINMENLSVLTNYIKKKYGSEHRIILSEQGYTSVQNGTKVEKEQAAAIAYSYLLTEADDMVDSFIMNRHVDHKVEVDQGLNLGLWTTTRSRYEYANKQKYAYNVFQYMDTSRSPEVTSFALKVLGVASWDKLIKEYDTGLYQKSEAVTAKASLIGGYKTKKSLAKSWKKYGAVSSASSVSGGILLTHSRSRNRNLVWGARRKEKADLSACSTFYTTVKITGSSKSSAQLKLRFRSGRHVLDASVTVPTEKSVKIAVDLSSWSRRNKITAIEVLASPKGGGGWKKGASMRITKAGAA